MVGGFSAGATFAPLFAMLHPQSVTHVISLDELVLLIAHGFDPRRAVRLSVRNWRVESRLRGLAGSAGAAEGKVFIYHGELDENDLIEGLANDDAEEAKAVKSIMGQTTTDNSSKLVSAEGGIHCGRPRGSRHRARD